MAVETTPGYLRQDHKYFIPRIEDLKVGYECETIQNNQWQTFIFTKESLAEFCLGYPAFDIRVKYLTEEQLLVLGWKKALGLGRFYKRTFEDYTTVDLLEKNCILISQNQTLSFIGECRDINTFKLLCQLLQIV